MTLASIIAVCSLYLSSPHVHNAYILKQYEQGAPVSDIVRLLSLVDSDNIPLAECLLSNTPGS